MIKNCIANLNQLKGLLEAISGEAYTRKSKSLSGATIGGHMRHVLEFYICLLDSVKQLNSAHVQDDPFTATVQDDPFTATVQVDVETRGKGDGLDREAPPVCVVNYGKRARDVEIETWPEKALAYIDFICEQLSSVRHRPEILYNEGQYDIAMETITRIRSSFDRELLYNLEHAIHHQALIRVSLLEQGLEGLVDKNFGMAPSTIRAMKSG